MIRPRPNQYTSEESAAGFGALTGGIVAYRIHFTSQDLARTCVAETPMALQELILALRVLRDRSRRARLDSWRRRSTAAPLSTGARMVLSLVPAIGYSPTYLGPALTGPPEEALERVRATSEHATVLRGAGLIQTVRHRTSAIHSATGLGIALLNAPRDPDEA